MNDCSSCLDGGGGGVVVILNIVIVVRVGVRVRAVISVIVRSFVRAFVRSFLYQGCLHETQKTETTNGIFSLCLVATGLISDYIYRLSSFVLQNRLSDFHPPMYKILTFGGGGKGERYRVKTSGGLN